MSLESLAAAIAREAATRAAAVEGAAEQEATVVAEAAAWRAEQARDAARREAFRPAAVARELHRLNAELAAVELRQKALTNLVERVLAAATTELTAARQRPAYDAFLARMLEEAIAALDTPGAIHIECDPRDEARMRRLLPANRPVTFDPSLHTAGGVCVAGSDRRIKVDNSLETRLANAQPALRARLGRFFNGTETPSHG